MNVPPNPPDITYQPWCPLIVVMKSAKSELKATIKDIAEALIDQIDPLRHGFRAKDDSKVNKSGGPLLQIKFRSVRAWNLTGHMIALSVNDISSDKSDNTDTLCGIADTGSANHTPAVGFEFPATHRDIVIRNDTGDRDIPIFHVVMPSGDSCVIYVAVFWRFDGPSKFVAFNLSIAAMLRKTNVAVQAVNRSLVTMEPIMHNINDKIEKIEEHTDKGGIGNAIIKGVEIAAPYVIPAIAAEDREVMQRMVKGIEQLNALEERSNCSSMVMVDEERWKGDTGRSPDIGDKE